MSTNPKLRPEQEAENILDALAEQARNDKNGRAFTAKDGFMLGASITANGRVRFSTGTSPRAVPRSDALKYLTDAIVERNAAEEVEARRIPLKAQVSYCDGPGGDTPYVSLKGTRLLRLGDSHDYFHVGAVPRGTEAVREHMGPKVPGPWAYTFGSASILCDDAATRERYARERAAAMVVHEGSVLRIDGLDYRVKVDKCGPWIKLDMVAP